MWGIFIIVFKPAGKLRHHSFGIRSIVAEDVIPLTMPSAAAKVIVSLAV